MFKILSTSSDEQSLLCSTIKHVISLSIEPPHDIYVNYFLEVSPLSLENLQHIKFSSCVSFKMICYPSYSLLCAWTKDRGTLSLRKRPPLFAAPLPTPLSPYPGRPLGSAASPRALPRTSTSAAGRHEHSGDTTTLSTHLGQSQSCSHVPHAPTSSRSPPQTTAQLLPPAPGVTNLLNEDLTGVVLPCPKVQLRILSPLSNLQLNCGEAALALRPTCGCNHPHHSCILTSLIKSTLFIICDESFKAYV